MQKICCCYQDERTLRLKELILYLSLLMADQGIFTGALRMEKFSSLSLVRLQVSKQQYILVYPLHPPMKGLLGVR